MKPASLVSLLALLILAGPSWAADPGKVSGSFSVEGKVYTPRYVYAVPRPSLFDRSKEDIIVLVSVDPIDDMDLTGNLGGHIYPRLSFAIAPNKDTHSVGVFDGRVSASGVARHLELKALDGQRVAGRIFTDGKVSHMSKEAQFDITFAASFFRASAAAPSADAGRTAAASPQAKTYDAYLRAVKAGSLPELLKVIPDRSAADWTGPSAKDTWTSRTSGAPEKVTYLRVRESGDVAYLEYDSEKVTGTVKMIREKGAWKLAKEDQKYKNNKNSLIDTTEF
jgi:hypothetical protein